MSKVAQVDNDVYSDVIYIVRTEEKFELERHKKIENDWVLGTTMGSGTEEGNEQIFPALKAKNLNPLTCSIDDIAQAVYEYQANSDLKKIEQLIDPFYVDEFNFSHLLAILRSYVEEYKVYCSFAGIMPSVDGEKLNLALRKFALSDFNIALEKADDYFNKGEYDQVIFTVRHAVEDVRDFVDDALLTHAINLGNKAYQALLKDVKEMNKSECDKTITLKYWSYLNVLSRRSEIPCISESDRREVLIPMFERYLRNYLNSSDKDTDEKNKQGKNEGVIRLLFILDSFAESLGISSDEMKKRLDHDWIKPHLVPELFDRTAVYDPTSSFP